MPITNTSDYGRHVAQTMLQGFQLGSNIRAQSQQAALALRGQQLQEQQFQQENDPGSLRNRYMQAQTRLMNYQADMAQASQAYVLAKNAAEAAALKRTMELKSELDFMAPEYAEVFQKERTAAYDAFATDKPYVPGKHISAYLAARGGKNGIAAMDERFTAMQDQLNKEIDQQLKLNPRAFEFQAKYRQYEQLLAEDPEKAEKFRTLAFPQGTTRTMTMDPVTGTMTVTEGSGSNAAFQNKVSEQIAGGREMGAAIDSLIPRVSPANVGVGGVLASIVNSSIISDIFPNAYMEGPAKFQQDLKLFRQQAAKALRVDSQMNEKEMVAIEAMLPKLSLATSANQVRDQMLQIRGMLGRGRRIWFEEAKRPIPPDLWKQDEIIAEANRRDKAGEFEDYRAKARWTTDAFHASLYPNEFNTDLGRVLSYAKRVR